MAGVSIEFEFKDKGIRAALHGMGMWREKAHAPIGMALIRGTQRRFTQQVSPEGQAWQKLLPAYAAIKRGPGILRASGMLFKSITAQTSPEIVRVGTNRIYARVHQFGAVIKPKSPGGRLVFRLGGGGGKKGKGSNSGVVFARSVKIPARPFLGISAEDEQSVGDVLEAIMFGGAIGAQ